VGQPRLISFLESILNCVVGIGVAIVGQILVFPLFDIHISLIDTGMIAVIFTGISIVRSYVLRRVFNWWHHRGGGYGRGNISTKGSSGAANVCCGNFDSANRDIRP
jgi:hypothetical protein